MGEVYSLVACLSHLIIDHASLSRRRTVPTPYRDTSNMWVLIGLGGGGVGSFRSPDFSRLVG